MHCCNTGTAAATNLEAPSPPHNACSEVAERITLQAKAARVLTRHDHDRGKHHVKDGAAGEPNAKPSVPLWRLVATGLATDGPMTQSPTMCDVAVQVVLPSTPDASAADSKVSDSNEEPVQLEMHAATSATADVPEEAEAAGADEEAP